MYFNSAIKQRLDLKLPKAIKPNKLVLLFSLIAILYFAFTEYTAQQAENEKTSSIVSNPQINDIYFLDFTLISEDLRPGEKYRIAKVVDITGDVITLIYSEFLYPYKNSAINSVKFGQLGFADYFSPRRYDLPLNTIQDMHNRGAIYLAERPFHNELYGKSVGAIEYTDSGSQLTYGRKENSKGEAFLNAQPSEANLETAFNNFKISSELGYANGQINLAEMYINGQHVNKDFNQALYWLKQASLQTNKRAILKYGIICKQVSSCNVADFYRELVSAGVNIKVKNLDLN